MFAQEPPPDFDVPGRRDLTYWLDQVVRVQRRPKTYEGYEAVVRRYLVPELGRKRLARLTVQDVRLMLSRVRARCLCCANGVDSARPAGRRRCCAVGACCQHLPSDRHVQFIHAVLRNALQNAMREEVVSRNVARLVQVRTPSYEVNRGLTVEQARTLLAEAASDRLAALYVLAVYLGLRRAELLGLRWVDVDLETGDLEVVQTLQRVGGQLQAVPPKTRSSRRTVPLPEPCLVALRQHRRRQARERLALGAGWTDSGLVFTTALGTPVEPGNLRRSWYPLRERAGIPDVRFHDMRPRRTGDRRTLGDRGHHDDLRTRLAGRTPPGPRAVRRQAGTRRVVVGTGVNWAARQSSSASRPRSRMVGTAGFEPATPRL